MKKVKVLMCLFLIVLILSACSSFKEEISSAAETTDYYSYAALQTESTQDETSVQATTAVTTTVSETTVTTTQAITVTSYVETTVPATAAITTTAVTTSQTTAATTTTAITTTETTTQKVDTCFVTIVCDTINNNIDILKSSKKAFVPSDGIILKDVPVEVKDGETAFDVIKRACNENTCKANCKYCQKNGIQIEYTYTPAFDNYYIEGIHQIYEKDCGTQSGWMYSVNGEFPNVGTSSYSVKAGDKIVFAYTCDMGEDIGNSY